LTEINEVWLWPAKNKAMRSERWRNPCYRQSGEIMGTSSGKPKGAKTQEYQRQCVSAEKRRHDIEVAAYYIAEKRGFSPAAELEDWVLAEREVAKQYFQAGLR
jgi:hypothetical protein